MSHKLAHITIHNYKSVIQETFELSDYTPMVGYNNAGKSNVLSAIKWLLRKSVLGSESFNNKSLPIIIEGKIIGVNTTLLQSLTATHRSSIQPYISGNQLEIRRVQAQPNDTAASIKLFVRNPTAVPPASQWILNPTGIDNALNALFPEPIQIGAMENAEEDVSKSKATSTIGKLLAEIIGPIETQYGTNVQTALNGLKDLLDGEGQNRATELTQFDNAVNSKIDSFFPDVSIKLHVPTPELKDVFSKGTIKVYEQQLPDGRDISALGHGAQRSIQMALILHLAGLRRTSQSYTTTTLLLIDEPELYLHPQAIEIVRDALKTLSTQGYQVVFSTHSAMMVTSTDIANAMLIRKNAVKGTHTRQTLKHAITQIENSSPSQIQLLFSLSNSSQILFSEKVILTEGRTEQKILPAIIEKVTGKTLGLHKCALVKQGGVTSTKKSMDVLTVMDLPTKAIVDLDYAFRVAVGDGFLLANDPDLIACHTHMAHIAPTHRITLEADGYPTKRGSSMTVAQAFELLANEPTVQPNIQNIHTKLLAHNIWIWKKGAIEQPLGLVSKDEHAWANFCSQIASNELQNVVSDYTEINACVTWLLA